MKYIDGLTYLDQMKDYVHTSLSSRQNVQQATIIHKVEQSENDDRIGDPLEMMEEIEDGNIEVSKLCDPRIKSFILRKTLKQNKRFPKLQNILLIRISMSYKDKLH